MSRYPSPSGDRSERSEHWIATPRSDKPTRATTTDVAHMLANLPPGWRVLEPEEIPDDQQQQTDVADTAAD